MDLLGVMSNGFDNDKPESLGSGVQIVEVAEITGLITEENAVAIEQDLEMFRGDDRVFRVAAKDSNGTAIPVTDATEIYFSVKKKTSDTSYILQKSKTGGGIVINDGPNGIIDVTILHADTNSIVAKTYRYDVELEDAANKIHTLAIGQLYVKPEITRT